MRALPLIAVLTRAATPAQVGLLTAAVWAPDLLDLLAAGGTLCCLWLLPSPCPGVRSIAELDHPDAPPADVLAHNGA